MEQRKAEKNQGWMGIALPCFQASIEPHLVQKKKIFNEKIARKSILKASLLNMFLAEYSNLSASCRSVIRNNVSFDKKLIYSTGENNDIFLN